MKLTLCHVSVLALDIIMYNKIFTIKIYLLRNCFIAFSYASIVSILEMLI